MAGPLGDGRLPEPEVELNVARAIAAAEVLVKLGFAPHVPHLYVLWNKQHFHDAPFWKALDLEWLRQCEALVRLPGTSSGMDDEIDEARKLEIPIFYLPRGLDALVDWRWRAEWQENVKKSNK